MSPPSTLRTERPVDPAEQSINEEVAPTLQQLIRLQIFTPMTLLLALGSNLVTVFAFHPGVGQIQDEYETIWTARKELIGGYLLLVSVELGRVSQPAFLLSPCPLATRCPAMRRRLRIRAEKLATASWRDGHSPWPMAQYDGGYRVLADAVCAAAECMLADDEKASRPRGCRQAASPLPTSIHEDTAR